MATDVVMPQMGESIAEGTIVRWIKKVGDAVERDEPLLEISTDKVDAEIPSPAGGIVSEIRAGEGDTVPVNSVIAVIVETSSRPEAASTPQKGGEPETAMTPASAPAPEPAQSQRAGPRVSRGEDSLEATIRGRSSPLVRRIAREHNVDIAQIAGTGLAGRVTRDDILGFISTAAAKPDAAAAPPAASPARSVSGAATGAGLAGQTVPMTVMRKRIAEHMVASRRTSAHVHTVFEVNFSRVAEIRAAKKAEYELAGASLTYLAFITRAVAAALRAVPVVNASVEGDNIVYHRSVNIGVAVALEWGLIVPVIRNADTKTLLGLSQAIADLANRARSKQLKPDEVSGGTFTITNPGALGALFGMPVINQPQVAILGVGNIGKRPVVIGDALSIRPMGHLSLGYDHRIIDGSVADEFMSNVKRTLESWDSSDV